MGVLSCCSCARPIIIRTINQARLCWNLDRFPSNPFEERIRWHHKMAQENHHAVLGGNNSKPTAVGDSNPTKPLVVRIKRKRLQAPVESLWLEVTGRPMKRPALDLSALSLDEHDGTSGEVQTTRLLFHHVETVSGFGVEEAHQVDCILEKVRNDNDMRERWKEQRQNIIKNKSKQDHLRMAAREMHEFTARSARFEQVWRSRKGVEDDKMQEIFHLYDVVRVDVESKAAERLSKKEQAKRDAELAESQLLCNYLPLLREYLPTAASELQAELSSQMTEGEMSSQTTERGMSTQMTEREMSSQMSDQDEFVYDMYALEEGADESEADKAEYPMVKILDDESFYWGESGDSDHDSEDSNDENNPINDYPEEEDASEVESGSNFEDDSEEEENDVWDAEGVELTDVMDDHNDEDYDLHDDDVKRWLRR